MVVTDFLSTIIKLQKWKMFHNSQFLYFKTTTHRAVHTKPHFRKATKISGNKIYLHIHICYIVT